MKKAACSAGTALILVLPHIVAAANLLDGNFESGGYYPFSEPTLKRGTAEIVTSSVYSGRYAFKSTIEIAANEPGSPSRSAVITGTFAPADSAPSHLFAKYYFLVDDSFTMTKDGDFSMFAALARTTVGAVWSMGLMLSSDQLYLNLRWPTGNDHGTTAVSRNRWYCVEIEFDQAQGNVRLYLDGNLEKELTGLTSLEAINELRLGWSTWIPNQGGSVYFDHATVSEERRTYQPIDMTIIHAPSFFGRIGMKFLVFLAGLTGSERFEATIEGAKGFKETVFSKNGNLEKNFDFNLNLRTLAADTYTLTIKLLDGRTQVVGSEVDTFTKPYDGLPVTGIDENSAVCFNGEPMFFVNAIGLRRGDLAFWTSRKYANLQRGYFDETQTPASFKDYLDKAAEAGTVVSGPLKDTTWVNRSAGGAPYPTLSEIDAAVNASKDHPALFFWDWMDEPITNNMNITGSTEGNIALVKSWTEESHAQDPKHLVFSSEWATISSFPTSQSKMFYPNWVCDVYSFDIYPIEFEADTGTELAEAAELNERFYRYNYGLLPFSAWVETGDVRPKGHEHATTLYPPTPEQLRMLSWIPIVHGAKGISWFHYFGAVPPENYSVMSELVRFTEQYSGVILGPEPKTISISDDANQLGKRVDTMVRESDTDIYVFAIRVSEFAGDGYYVNPAEQGDIQVSFTLTGGPSSASVEDVLASFKAANHKEWSNDSASQQQFTLTLDTSVEPGSVVLGGGSGSADSDVGYPTAWTYLFDDGNGNLKSEYSWEYQSGTIDYTTGAISVDFAAGVDQGAKKIHAGFVPKDAYPRSLSLSNGVFQDTFKRGELHVYRIPKSGGLASSNGRSGCGYHAETSAPSYEVLWSAVALAPLLLLMRRWIGRRRSTL